MKSLPHFHYQTYATGKDDCTVNWERLRVGSSGGQAATEKKIWKKERVSKVPVYLGQ